MKVLKARLTCISNNKFNWEYHNLDTGEKGILQLESSMDGYKIVSVDNDTKNSLPSYGEFSFKEIQAEKIKRQTKGRINYDYFSSKSKRRGW